MAGIDVKQNDDAVSFEVRVIPRSSRSEIVGEFNGALKVRLAAPPVEGAANDELVRLLAKEICVSRSDVEIVSGHSSRTKRVRVKNSDVGRIGTILKPKS